MHEKFAEKKDGMKDLMKEVVVILKEGTPVAAPGVDEVTVQNLVKLEEEAVGTWKALIEVKALTLAIAKKMNLVLSILLNCNETCGNGETSSD